MNRRARLTRQIRKFFINDENGAIIIYVAALIPVIIALTALVAEMGYAYGRKGGMQAAVDAAAMAGAIQAMASPPTYGATAGSSSEIDAIINEVYASLSYTPSASNYTGYTNGASDKWGTISVTPPSFRANGNNYEITATITNTMILPILSVAADLSKKTYINTKVFATATARVRWRGDICMLALSPVGMGFHVAGSGTIGSSSDPKCGIAVDSYDPCAFDSRGTSATIDVPLYTVGGVCMTGNPTIPPISHGYPVKDPYDPDTKNALINAYNAATTVVDPACSGNCTITLNANEILSDKFFKSTLCSTCKVTINSANGLIPIQNLDYKKPNQTIAYSNPSTMIVGAGTISIGASSPNTFNAPTSGIYQGISIACILTCSSVTVGGSAIMNGSIYAPSADVTYSGDPTSPCIQIIASTITTLGSVSLTDGCIPPAHQMREYEARLIR